MYFVLILVLGIMIKDFILDNIEPKEIEVMYFDSRVDTVEMVVLWVDLDDGCLTSIDRQQICGISKAKIID